MQDTFARARPRALGLKAARPSARATIGYLVYNTRRWDEHHFSESVIRDWKKIVAAKG